MIEHDFQYLRDMATIAMTDHSSRTKGQLEAFEGFVLGNTTRYPRRKPRDITVNGRKISRKTEAVSCWSTHYSVLPMPLIDRVDYQNCSWRRAIMELDEAEQSWLLYCYGKELKFSHQTAITAYVWDEMQERIKGRRVSKKMNERLRALVWLAVQDYTLNKAGYYYQSELAELVGVTAKNWNNNYKNHWQELLLICKTLDCGSLQKMRNNRVEIWRKNTAKTCKSR
ncbi:bacteriophage antitermination protein Q [Morganella morganii]|uniref:bacteriophage antitermination protein Q n=1 Tax=Morganella morganii TaxID=582 RepID=UPI001BD6A7D9|nr:bacteriophage antitermination protein Q [Morganella morganii]